MEWLGDFARDYEADAMVTDDLSAYNPVGERQGIDHQICISHVEEAGSEDGTLNGFGLRRWAWSGRDGLDPSELVAAQRRSLGEPRSPKPAQR